VWEVNASVSEEEAAGATTKRIAVTFEIATDGSFSVSLGGTTGSGAVDRAILFAARRWKWKPALEDGRAVASVRVRNFSIRAR
jgi:outer membrane biosynthesis protein TonB